MNWLRPLGTALPKESSFNFRLIMFPAKELETNIGTLVSLDLYLRATQKQSIVKISM